MSEELIFGQGPNGPPDQLSPEGTWTLTDPGIDILAGIRKLSGDLDGTNAQNQANLDLWEKYRDWQTDMSNTAYQRQAIDMKKAGLNPITGFGSGASTPSAQPPKIERSDAIGNLGSILSSAFEIARFGQDKKYQDAQVDLMDAQKNQIEANSAKTEFFEPFWKGGKEFSGYVGDMLGETGKFAKKVTTKGIETVKDFTKKLLRKKAESRQTRPKSRKTNYGILQPLVDRLEKTIKNKWEVNLFPSLILQSILSLKSKPKTHA